MDENRKASQNSPGISRRLLVKSALTVAPVVLTLRSGAVLANASAYQCILRDQQRADANANPLRDPTEADDDWARQTVNVKQLQDSQNNTFWVYEDPQSPGSWLKEDGSPVNLSDYTEIGSGTGAVQILFDDMGQITGYGKVGSGGPITGSCWASFDP
ncbi:hypothetical protein JCM13664_15510 [Methylothermus subterraneus]